MKRFHCFLPAACLLLTALFPLSAAAYDQPLGLNLGLTSFLDGGPPAGPGWYLTEYMQLYTADEFRNPPGPIASNGKVEAWIGLNQVIYQSDQVVLLGGKWGLDVIVPLVGIDARDRNGVLTGDGGGVGDVYIGPFLQWDPIMGKNGPLFMHRVELQTIWPTGVYDNDMALNTGSNFFSFNPYWAATYFIMPKLTASCRLHYLWNDKNSDPFTGGPTVPDKTQAGQALHGNFALSYEVMPKKLRLGLNGYYFKQVTNSEADGTDLAGKEQVFAIGPGALLSLSKDTHLFFNAYFESNVKSRPEGERYVVRLVHHF